jgi:ABC-type Na+ efflux pump permease subunit
MTSANPLPQPSATPTAQFALPPPPVIENDLKCLNCGYNLRGLRENAQCPECGFSIADTIDDALRPCLCDRNGRWVTRLAMGAVLLAILGASPWLLCLVGVIMANVGRIFSLFGGNLQESSFTGGFVLGLGAFLSAQVGIWLLTCGDPEVPRAARQSGLRWALRITSLIACVNWIVSLQLQSLGPHAPAALRVLWIVGLAVSWLLLPMLLGLHLSRLARRLPSQALSRQILVLLPVAVPLVLGFAVICWSPHDAQSPIDWDILRAVSGTLIFLVFVIWMPGVLFTFTMRLVRSARLI